MKFVNPWILISAVPVLIIASAFYIAAERGKLQLLAKIPGGASGENSSLSRAKRRWKFILLLCGMVLLLIAGARPYIHVIQLPAQERSRDILVLFDVSKSMLATDLPPDRMAQAKFFLRDIIKSFPSDRFGIVPFAGNAFLSCPLTSDHHALMTAVNELDISAVPVIKKYSHLPIIVDPSHGTGQRYLIEPMAKAGLVVGADGGAHAFDGKLGIAVLPVPLAHGSHIGGGNIVFRHILPKGVDLLGHASGGGFL